MESDGLFSVKKKFSLLPSGKRMIEQIGNILYFWAASQVYAFGGIGNPTVRTLEH
jgi:hypothetical protein